MPRTYQDVTANRRARLSTEAQNERTDFEHAYDIAMQVIELRERHGLTQAELADRCNMDQADISRIERASTSPTARTLQRIADALDADGRLVARISLPSTDTPGRPDAPSDRRMQSMKSTDAWALDWPDHHSKFMCHRNDVSNPR